MMGFDLGGELGFGGCCYASMLNVGLD